MSHCDTAHPSITELVVDFKHKPPALANYFDGAQDVRQRAGAEFNIHNWAHHCDNLTHVTRLKICHNALPTRISSTNDPFRRYCLSRRPSM